MKKHMKTIIRQAKTFGESEITAMVMTNFKKQGFELVMKKDIKKAKRTIEEQQSTINELIRDNWEITSRLHKMKYNTNSGENTSIEASNLRDINSISIQAKTEGLRRDAGAETNRTIDEIINSLDLQIDQMTNILDDANATRIKRELDEQDALLNEPETLDLLIDPVQQKACELYLKYLAVLPALQARDAAIQEVKFAEENTEYWNRVLEYLQTMTFQF